MPNTQKQRSVGNVPVVPRDEQATYPSGLTRPFPTQGDLTVRAWGQDLQLEIDAQPLGTTASCMNPECTTPVTFRPGPGQGPFYCSHHCRTRASRMRARATQQLHIIEESLSEEHRSQHGIPRRELQHRARLLRWWLTRLAPSTFEVDAPGDHDH